MSDRGSGGRDPSGPGGERGDGRSGGDPEDRALADRLAKLGRSLERPSLKPEPNSTASTDTSGWGQAVKISSEFVAGIIVGAGLGWFVDWMLGSSPFGLVIFLLLGFAAGVLNVLRVTGRVTTPGGGPGRR